ncbi:MAG: hypothetical protein GWN58_14500, partial [Anaerolineae bacterium]|nr:hypothetical protein [Anaerolineae bacterium]
GLTCERVYDGVMAVD